MSYAYLTVLSHIWSFRRVAMKNCEKNTWTKYEGKTNGYGPSFRFQLRVSRARVCVEFSINFYLLIYPAALWFRFKCWQAQDTYFPLLHSVQTGVAHLDSYPVGTGGCFSGVKRPGREADYPFSVEVKNGRTIHSPIRLHGVVID
jgi:hypothetical protein